MANYGFNSLVQTFSPTNAGVPLVPPFVPARVIDVILDDYHPEFENQGAWDSIGTIQFKPIYSVIKETSKNAFLFAKPFFSNIKHYPLKNEIVFITFLSNQETRNTSVGSYYYVDTINIWSSIHHNALPDELNFANLPEEQKRDYIQTSAGASRRITDESTNIELGKTFKEKYDIRSLLPYEGDTIIEGRWGQSIRFGSTVIKSNIPNLWSTTGSNGDPITIFRNGQSNFNLSEGWVPTLEDINLDGSSIYIGSYQNIPIAVSSTNIASFNTALGDQKIENIIISDVPVTPTDVSKDQKDNNINSNTDPDPTTSTTQTSQNIQDQNYSDFDAKVKANDWSAEDDFFIVKGTYSNGINLKEIGDRWLPTNDYTYGNDNKMIRMKGVGNTVNEATYRSYKDDPKIYWAIYDITENRLIAASTNASKNVYGASVPKVVTAGAALDINNGSFPSLDYYGKLALLLTESENAYWTPITLLAGGSNVVEASENVDKWSKAQGYKNMIPGRKTANEVNAIDMCLYFNDVCRNKFKGAEVIFKTTSSNGTGGARSRKYLPKDVYIGSKTGTWSTYYHDCGWIQKGDKFYAISVLTTITSNEPIALMWGGLYNEYAK